MSRSTCIYCGLSVRKADREHVVPRCLYPNSKSLSTVQRLTVSACRECNGSWSDDEAHFRNVMLIAGEPNAPVKELWETSARRSFRKVDGRKRILDLYSQMQPVETGEGPRHKVFPAKDERVMRIIRKITRGLCHHHDVMSTVTDQQVTSDVLKFPIQREFIEEMAYHHLEKDVFEYRYKVIDEPEIHSAWLLTFFERTTFITMVSPS